MAWKETQRNDVLHHYCKTDVMDDVRGDAVFPLYFAPKQLQPSFINGNRTIPLGGREALEKQVGVSERLYSPVDLWAGWWMAGPEEVVKASRSRENTRQVK